METVQDIQNQIERALVAIRKQVWLGLDDDTKRGIGSDSNAFNGVFSDFASKCNHMNGYVSNGEEHLFEFCPYCGVPLKYAINEKESSGLELPALKAVDW